METFISYKFDDRNKYEDVCYAFDRAGIRYWSTTEIAAAQGLRDKLQNAIRRCSVCVFIAAPNSLESGWCQAEIGAFWGLGRPVVVYLADDKLTEDSLPKQFVGDKFAKTIREVVESVKVHLGEPRQISQVEAIACLAIDSFIDKLTLQFKTVWFLGFGTLAGILSEKPNLRYTNAFGKRVSYDRRKAGLEAESERRLTFKRIDTFRHRREQQIVETLLKLFTGVQGQAESIARHLSRIQYENTTLSEPWARAQDSLLHLWEEKSKELSYFSLKELDWVREFLEEHPAYQKVYAEEKTTIDSFLHSGELSLDELIEITRSHLTKTFKELLTTP